MPDEGLGWRDGMRNLPFDPADGAGAVEVATGIREALTPFPYLAELVGHLTDAGSYVFADQFDEGLDVILSELSRRVPAV